MKLPVLPTRYALPSGASAVPSVTSKLGPPHVVSESRLWPRTPSTAPRIEMMARSEATGETDRRLVCCARMGSSLVICMFIYDQAGDGSIQVNSVGDASPDP